MGQPAFRRWAFAGLVVALGPAAGGAQAADDAHALLRQAIATRSTASLQVRGERLSAVYVEALNPCAFAALVHGSGEIENFSICGGVMNKRNAAPPAWPDTPASREFRARVIGLALLYRTSSGIDPNGYKIRATLTEGASDACKIAEVATIAGNALVRLDLLPACPQ
jgi:hypothetical protein